MAGQLDPPSSSGEPRHLGAYMANMAFGMDDGLAHSLDEHFRL